jgi:hypothetical protein
MNKGYLNIVFNDTIVTITCQMFNFVDLQFRASNDFQVFPNEKIIACKLYDKECYKGGFYMGVGNKACTRLLEPYVDYQQDNVEHGMLLNSLLEEYVNNILGHFTASPKMVEEYGSLSFSVPWVEDCSKNLVDAEPLGILSCGDGVELKFLMSLDLVPLPS